MAYRGLKRLLISHFREAEELEDGDFLTHLLAPPVDLTEAQTCVALHSVHPVQSSHNWGREFC